MSREERERERGGAYLVKGREERKGYGRESVWIEMRKRLVV